MFDLWNTLIQLCEYNNNLWDMAITDYFSLMVASNWSKNCAQGSKMYMSRATKKYEWVELEDTFKCTQSCNFLKLSGSICLLNRALQMKGFVYSLFKYILRILKNWIILGYNFLIVHCILYTVQPRRIEMSNSWVKWSYSSLNSCFRNQFNLRIILFPWAWNHGIKTKGLLVV